MNNSEFTALVDWLGEHSQAYSDCCEHFGVYDLYDLDDSRYNDLVAWISEHDQLYEDYLRHFNHTYRVYYYNGNQKLYEAPNIVDLIYAIPYAEDVYKIEEVE